MLPRHIRANVHPVVRANAQDVHVVRRVVDLAEGEAVGDLGESAFVAVLENVRGPGDFGLTMSGRLYQECLTIEANTHERRAAEGDSILRRSRRLSAEAGDRFVRWHEVDVRAERMGGFLVRGDERAEENERAKAEVEAAGLLPPALPLHPFSPIG